MSDFESRGIVQVYTGCGKGKTSAAWGQALRAAGHGLYVCVVRFLKPEISGEVLASEHLKPYISVFGYTSPYDACADQRHSDILRSESRSNFQLAVESVKSDRYDLVVLDEINNVLDYGFVSLDEMINLINNRPPHVDIILTGRYAPSSVIDISDLITEMLDIKHPFTAGEKSRRGIEY
ncbi:MAG: cob(I)yrinic acid a,c-diamide adenosyltransferase [Armatimonadota bacterium]